MPRSLCWVIIVGVLMTPTVVSAQIQNAKIELTDGRSVSTSALQLQDGLLAGPSLPPGLNLANVLSISTDRSQDTRAGTIRIELLDGGFIWADKVQIQNERIEFSSSRGLSSKSLSLENLRGITFSYTDFDAAIFDERSADSDVVIVKTNSGLRRVPGILEGLTSSHVLLNYQNKSRRIALNKVLAVVTADLELESASGTIASIKLTDGSTLVGKLTSIGTSVEFQLPRGNPLTIAPAKIAKIEIESDALAYLSDLAPVESIVEPQFAPLRSLQMNRSITNGPLLLHNDRQQVVTFSRGIGTMAYSRLSFSNANNFDQFKAVAGIDAATNGRGDCKMTVRGDGVELWSKRVRGKEPFVDIDVSIKGMKIIELIVEPGEKFDLGDHANWCDARFLKTN